MKLRTGSLLAVSLSVIVAFHVTPAWAQLGLYGSPRPVNLHQSNAYHAPPTTGYVTASTPGYTTAPPAGYVAAPSAGYVAAPTTGYVATSPQASYQVAPPTAYQPAPVIAPQYAAQPQPYAVGTAPSTPAFGHPARLAPTAGLRHSAAPLTLPITPRLLAVDEIQRTAAPLEMRPNIVDQMLTEADAVNPNVGLLDGTMPATEYNDAVCDESGCFQRAILSPWCDNYDSECCTSPWFASASALYFNRDKANRVWTTYEWGNEPNQLFNTQDVGYETRWGGQVRFGRRFCCDRWAFEATYWTLNPLNAMAGITDPAGLGTPLVVSGIEFGGDNATDFFDDSAGHRLWRYNEFHNVELNLIRNRVLTTDSAPWDVSWMAGIRFFRFQENLTFGGLANGETWGQNAGASEAYLNDNIKNNLLGFQIGFSANYYIAPTWRLFVTPKFGIYNNHISNYFQAQLGNGVVAQPTAASGVVGTYPVESSTNVVSFLTEVDLGLEWLFSERWSARIGYRVVAITNMGLADNQFPPYIVDIPEIAAIDTNGDLVLHGGFAGLTFNY